MIRAILVKDGTGKAVLRARVRHDMTQDELRGACNEAVDEFKESDPAAYGRLAAKNGGTFCWSCLYQMPDQDLLEKRGVDLVGFDPVWDEPDGGPEPDGRED